MNPPSPPPFSCIGSITLQWPLKLKQKHLQGAHAYWCANLLQLRSPTAVYTFRKSRHQWTQSHFVQIESCVYPDWASGCWRGKMTFLIQEDQIFSRWTQWVYMVFFESVENQNPQQKLQHPKEIHGWVSRKWWDFRVSFVQGNSPPIFTCSRAQGSPRNPIKSGAGFPQIRFTEILPWWSSSQQRPYWTTCWWSPNSLEVQQLWQKGLHKSGCYQDGWDMRKAAKPKHCGNRKWT